MSMKRIFILLLKIFALQQASSQTLIPQVDKRLEMMSIVFRLAGNREYNDKDASKYVSHIQSHFDQFQSDSLIAFAKFLHEEYGVSYDAVMSMAVNLKLSGKTF